MSLPTESESDPATFVVAQTRSGVEKRFDTEHTVCAEFGFFAGERVHTPRGPAWVIGVNNGDLYFNIDGDKGASKWVGCKMADFQSRGFRLLFSNHQQRPPTGDGLAKRSLTNSHHAPHLRNLINDVQFSDTTFLLDPETEEASQGGIDDGNPDDVNPASSSSIPPVRVHAMRGLLVARSEYFRSLFSRQNGMEESNKNEIRLHSVTPSIFLLVLEYLYCGAVEYQPHQAAPLLKAADLLLLFDLKTDCAQFLTRQVSKDNCILLLQLANQFQLDILRLSCLECLIKHLPVRDSPLRIEWMALVSQQPDISLMLIDRLCSRHSCPTSMLPMQSAVSHFSVPNPSGAGSAAPASPATQSPANRVTVQVSPQMPIPVSSGQLQQHSLPQHAAPQHMPYYSVAYSSIIPMMPQTPSRSTSVNQAAPSPATQASPSVWRVISQVAQTETEEPTAKRSRANDESIFAVPAAPHQPAVILASESVQQPTEAAPVADDTSIATSSDAPNPAGTAADEDAKSDAQHDE